MAPEKRARTAATGAPSSSSPPAAAAPKLTLRGGMPHHPSLAGLWRDERLTDFALCAEGVEFKAHRVALASSSKYFLNLFESGMRDASDATHALQGISPQALKALLAFVYEGTCEIEESLLTEVLEAAARLVVDALKEACAQAIGARLTPSNALNVWHLANTFTLPALEKAAQRCIEELPSQLATDVLPAIPILPDEILAHIGRQAYNPLEPRLTVYISSASRRLRVLLTPELRQQLKDEHEAAAALCLNMGVRSCKELREAREIDWTNKGLSVTDLITLGTLGSVLPALEKLILYGSAGGPDSVQRLAEGLGAGALPAVSYFSLGHMHVGDAGAAALAAALGRGALPRLSTLHLYSTAIGDAGLVALAPSLRRLPDLKNLLLLGTPFGDKGLVALLAPPPPAGALPLLAGGLKKLKSLCLVSTQVTDTGCVALALALDSGALPALEYLSLNGIPASVTAKEAVDAALARSRAAFQSYAPSCRRLS